MASIQSKFIVGLVAVLLVAPGCGGDEGSASGEGGESTANQPDFAMVQSLVEEWTADTSKVDPGACPVTKVEEASEGGQRVTCYDEEEISLALDAAIRWEFPDGAAAQKFIDEAGTSSEYHLFNDNVVIDGPSGSTEGMYDAQEFLTALSEQCGCGEVLKKE